MDYMKLKSGTDIRGIASEGVQGENINLTDEVIENIAGAFLLWCEKHIGKKACELKIAIGHDSRISADRISTCLKKVFTEKGVKVSDCGLASTPSMFMAVLELPADASVQITASHHPFNRNGLKFFTKDGGLDAPDISEILELAGKCEAPENCQGGEVKAVDYMDKYSANLRKMIKDEVNAENYEKPLEGFKIVVDAGNGAGGFYVNSVLAPLGADTEGSQFLEPDGYFPNHIPNPENETAMKFICDAVIKNHADLGVIFDTDVDRGGAVDSEGNEINRNALVAIASAIALENNPGGTIVTDSITSDGLHDYIENTLGGKHHRFKRGYKNVINEAIRLGKEGLNVPLAIETSGHAAMKENYYLDDGAYLVTKIIIKMAKLRKEGKALPELISSLKHAKEEREFRFKICAQDFRPIGEKIITDLELYAEKSGWDIAPDNREGLRVSFPEGQGDGWFLLRMSVHDPIMPLNIESMEEGGVKKIARAINRFFFYESCPELDLSSLISFIK